MDTRGVVVAEDAFTTLAFVTLDARGERSFPLPASRARTRNSALRNWTSRSSKKQKRSISERFLTDEPARGGATQRAVAYAKERGKLITFDPNLRPPL